MIEKKLEAPLPAEFKGFLKQANGLTLFSSRINIWGSRAAMSRTGDCAWQPHDIVDHNFKTMRPHGSPENVLFFGSVENGESWCFFEFDEKNTRIGKTNREAFHPTSYWPDFNSWLLDATRSIYDYGQLQ